MTDAARFSVDMLAKRDMEEMVAEDICDITALMVALKLAAIDREKLEAVENFIEHGGDELFYLRDRMHDIMRMFIFQASRKILVSHLHKTYNELVKQSEEVEAEDDDDNKGSETKRRVENLRIALEHADEEVKKLEYWSDVKEMAENGETIHGVDQIGGWDAKEWEGIDISRPKDVISRPHEAGNIKKRQENGMNVERASSKTRDGTNNENGGSTAKGKGKDKAKE
ncbi:hypothetical protein M7I_0500 [Glarea lozoyensis 74030]|nr:hypothetical protein M7I_0500 [Glarea lozoyensis 74030]